MCVCIYIYVHAFIVIYIYTWSFKVDVQRGSRRRSSHSATHPLCHSATQPALAAIQGQPLSHSARGRPLSHSATLSSNLWRSRPSMPHPIQNNMHQPTHERFPTHLSNEPSDKICLSCRFHDNFLGTCALNPRDTERAGTLKQSNASFTYQI